MSLRNEEQAKNNIEAIGEEIKEEKKKKANKALKKAAKKARHKANKKEKESGLNLDPLFSEQRENVENVEAEAEVEKLKGKELRIPVGEIESEIIEKEAKKVPRREVEEISRSFKDLLGINDGRTVDTSTHLDLAQLQETEQKPPKANFQVPV